MDYVKSWPGSSGGDHCLGLGSVWGGVLTDTWTGIWEVGGTERTWRVFQGEREGEEGSPWRAQGTSRFLQNLPRCQAWGSRTCADQRQA